MTGPAARLKELGRLCRNVTDAAALTDGPAHLISQEIADWVRVATAIIGELVIDGAVAQEPPKGEPAMCTDCGGPVVDEAGRPLLLVEPRCFDCAVYKVVEHLEGHS